MNPDRNIFQWSIPLGRWFAVQVKLSVFFVLIAMVLVFRWGDWRIGVTFGLMLFLSVLLHEFGHVFAARITGGDGDEILITPFGGLAMCMPASTFASQFWTTAGGPVVNLGLCLVTLTPVIQSPHTADCFNPIVFPAVSLAGKSFVDAMPDVLIILFMTNWLLLLLNLVPVHPLDGGRLLHTLLSSRLERFVARNAYLKVGSIAGVILLVVGLLMDNTIVMAIAAIVLFLNVMEMSQMQMSEQYDDSFMGYDFSQGYTSLERDGEDQEVAVPREREPGMIARWKIQRDEEKRKKQEDEDLEMERRLDELLAKLHASGETGLSPAEHRQLQEISERMRDRDQSE
jgi:stage IV sporulation protein FB